MEKSRIFSFFLTTVIVFGFVHLATAKERQGTVTIEVNLNARSDARTVRLWLPYPMSDENQDITNISVSGNYASSGVYRDAKNKATALYAEWKEPAKERKLVYSFHVNRNEVIRKEFPKKEMPLPVEEMNPYLSNAHLGDAVNKVKAIASEITKGQKTILAKAQAVYNNWVVDNMRRDPDVKGCGTSEVERLLSEKAGKCADIHSVYTALARASGVPAHEIYGLRMHKDKDGDITKYQDCWEEFYLPGYGWVVVDPADVLKFKLERSPTPEELKAKREYFFGAVDENRIALNSGGQIVLNPPPNGNPLLYFMYPYAEADGKALNEDLYGFNIGYKISFKEN